MLDMVVALRWFDIGAAAILGCLAGVGISLLGIKLHVRRNVDALKDERIEELLNEIEVLRMEKGRLEDAIIQHRDREATMKAAIADSRLRAMAVQKEWLRMDAALMANKIRDDVVVELDA